ncbi:uncharacterized protein LOC135218739 [Macrobrachium nipponense]|uniref:uncharacterized protein LOC135218739 n=1 Tax=Macrobrachium nipponense TaxID=159736 RepID=UPI0030C81091
MSQQRHTSKGVVSYKPSGIPAKQQCEMSQSYNPYISVAVAIFRWIRRYGSPKMVLKLKSRKLPALLFTVLASCTLIHTTGRIWHPTAYLWASFQPYLVQVTSPAGQGHGGLKDSSSDVEYDYSDGSSNHEVIPRAKKYSAYWPSQRNSHHWSRRFVDDSPILYVPTERTFQPSTTEESSLYAPLEKLKSFLGLPKSFESLFGSSVSKETTPSPFPEFQKVNYSKEELKAFPPVSIPMQVSGDDEDYAFSSVNEDVDTVDIKPTAKNVTPSNARLLIYNRVPKCGSTTFNSILDRQVDCSVCNYEVFLRLHLSNLSTFNFPFSGEWPHRSWRLVIGKNFIFLSFSLDRKQRRTNGPQSQLELTLKSDFRLCKINFLRCEHSTIYDQHWIDTASRRKLLHRAMYGHKMIRSKIFERHIYFFNVTRLGLPRAAWINLVREPVSRYISNFYYIRKRSRWNSTKLLKKQKSPPPWWFDMSLDDCIEVGRPECHPSSSQMNLQLTFFCGHHPECRKVGSRWALYRAKRHAEQYYSVVGILEEFTLSLSVLEGYLPRYFGNVHNIRLSSGEVKLNTNNSPSSTKRVSAATLETLQSLLKEDLEFYEFLRQRLHLQAMALGILTT